MTHVYRSFTYVAVRVLGDKYEYGTIVLIDFVLSQLSRLLVSYFDLV